MSPKSSNTFYPFAVGIDVGGTTSRAALFDQHDKVVDAVRCDTPGRFEELLGWITAEYHRWCDFQPNPIPIGLALPGVIDSANGIIIRSVNLPWLEAQPIVDRLETETGQRSVLMTDAEAATWGEYLDSGSPASPFAHLRLGTGVACGIVVEGKLISTDPARRTHLPLLIVDDGADAPLCSCGLRGCLESFAGGDGIARRAREMGFRDLAELHRGCLSNHEAAVRIVDQAAIAVCRAIANLAVEYGAGTVMMGGGVLTGIPKLLLRIQESVAKSAHPTVQVQLSRLGDDAGVIGAARLIRDASRCSA